ncbi:MAG: cell division FtsA domain-containing protein [Candidatus Saccharibacteria bacterium]
MNLEVIATFLPRVVVDSLFSALRKSDLEVSSLTLEPIAALSAAMPPNMRLLNLALVDIGAGTSDIALINKGTIFGYAMVPMGGDEITEAIAEQYLLDFNTAESIKCKLTKESTVTFYDILENEITARSAEIIAEIRPAIRELANSIAVEIVAINQKSPDAVICVGGGSMTPLLLAELASALELPERRVGVRTREALANIIGDFPALTGPQAITPIGIGIIALNSHNLPLVKVAVNDRDVPLWGLNEVTVASALLASGVNLNNIYGRPGMGLTVEVNGVLKVFKGKMGTLPVIRVNGEPAGLDTPLQEGDIIEFTRGEDGVDAVVYVRDLVEESQGTVVVNEQPVKVPPLIVINGEEKGLDDPIPDRSKVELVKGNRLSTVLAASGFDANHLRQREFNYIVNGKETRFLWSSAKAYVKSKLMEVHSPVSFGDEVNCLVGSERPTLGEVLQIDEMSETVTVRVNGDLVKLPKRKVTVKMNNNPATLDDFLEDEAEIQLTETNRMIILSDVLNHISVDTRPAGKLILRVNGEEAGFTTPLKDNDQIEITWENLPQ